MEVNIKKDVAVKLPLPCGKNLEIKVYLWGEPHDAEVVELMAKLEEFGRSLNQPVHK